MIKLLSKMSWGERIHLAGMIISIGLIYPSIFWWKDSVPYLVGLSVASLIIGEASAFQGAKAERNSPDA